MPSELEFTLIVTPSLSESEARQNNHVYLAILLLIHSNCINYSHQSLTVTLFLSLWPVCVFSQASRSRPDISLSNTGGLENIWLMLSGSCAAVCAKLKWVRFSVPCCQCEKLWTCFSIEPLHVPTWPFRCGCVSAESDVWLHLRVLL